MAKHEMSTEEVAKAKSALDAIVTATNEKRLAALTGTIMGERVVVLAEQTARGTMRPVAVVYDDYVHSLFAPDYKNNPPLEVVRGELKLAKPGPQLDA